MKQENEQEQWLEMCKVFAEAWRDEARQAGVPPTVASGWRKSLSVMLRKGATTEDILVAVMVAWDGSANDSNHRWLRFCRVVWNVIGNENEVDL